MRMVVAAAALSTLAISALPGVAMEAESAPVTAVSPPVTAGAVNRIVGLGRLSDAQYRNTIADIFGTDINIPGGFEPFVRASHQLLATSATSVGISPGGLDKFDVSARTIAAEVLDPRRRQIMMPCSPAGSGLA